MAAVRRPSHTTCGARHAPASCAKVDRALTLLVVLSGCAMEVEPERIESLPSSLRYLDLQQVGWDGTESVQRDVSECTGAELDLTGWRLYIARNVVRASCDGRLLFRCPEEAATECEADGHTHCGCGGATVITSRAVIVAPDRVALPHELLHVATGEVGHAGDEWGCVE